MSTLLPRRTSVAAFDERFKLNPDSRLEMRVRDIIDSVRKNGETSLRSYAEQFDGLHPNTPLVLGRSQMKKAFLALDRDDQRVLENATERIRAFARAQLACLSNLDVAVPGGRAGHRIIPVERAGCYAPGGRYSLPSSVLMTVIPAVEAGVQETWVASPGPSRITLAAAWVAGAEGVLAAGGAQAIAGLVFGVGPIPEADVVVGPGNRYVTMAKRILSGDVRIDMLAGPSELVVIADETADPRMIAADLLAQAEHDEYAIPVLIAIAESMVSDVRRELETQLETLPTAPTARVALKNGGVLLAPDLDTATEWCDQLAPEHVQLFVRNAKEAADRLHHFGTVFIGEQSAEVFGDYGVGPNHVLPTGRTARSTAGLSVFTFLRVQTWLHQTRPSRPLIADSTKLARLEGLEAHARAAELRSRKRGQPADGIQGHY